MRSAGPLDPDERVLEPVLIAFGKIFARVGATALGAGSAEWIVAIACRSRFSSSSVSIRSVFQTRERSVTRTSCEALEGLVNAPCSAFRVAGPKDRGVRLHGLLHLEADSRGGPGPLRVPNTVEPGYREVARILQRAGGGRRARAMARSAARLPGRTRRDRAGNSSPGGYLHVPTHTPLRPQPSDLERRHRIAAFKAHNLAVILHGMPPML